MDVYGHFKLISVKNSILTKMSVVAFCHGRAAVLLSLCVIAVSDDIMRYCYDM